jgi:hypothetical protein
MSSPPSWAVGDLEKQDISDSGAPPTEGGTTLADETPAATESEVFCTEENSYCTDRLKTQ